MIARRVGVVLTLAFALTLVGAPASGYVVDPQTPTPSVSPSPSATSTPGAPQPEETEGVGPTPQYTEAPVDDVERLAESGGVVPLWPYVLIVLGAVGLALVIDTRRAGR